MSVSVTDVVVVEHGANVPSSALEAAGTSDLARSACVVAQLAGEDDRRFRQRVAARLRRLAHDGMEIRSVQLLLGRERKSESLERRLMLAQTLITALPNAAEGELVLRGDLGQTPAGQLDVWAIIETLTALPLGWATRVRAIFENPASASLAVAA